MPQGKTQTNQDVSPTPSLTIRLHFSWHSRDRSAISKISDFYSIDFLIDCRAPLVQSGISHIILSCSCALHYCGCALGHTLLRARGLTNTRYTRGIPATITTMPPSSTATVAAAHGSATAARARFGSTGISTSSSVDPRWPRGQEPTAFDEEGLHPPQVLARKLTSGVLSVVFLGGCLILLIQVSLTLTAVPDWSADTKQAMIDLEQENILKLASDKAGYVDEVFGRVRGGLLQLRDFAGQALLALPQTIVVEQYLMDYPGLEQSGTTWDHSGW